MTTLRARRIEVATGSSYAPRDPLTGPRLERIGSPSAAIGVELPPVAAPLTGPRSEGSRLLSESRRRPFTSTGALAPETRAAVRAGKPRRTGRGVER